MTACSLKELTLYFLKLGTFGWGGPVALVGYMHRDLVEQRKWLPEDDFREGLALAQLAPGPLAAQLAIYIGFLQSRILGATIVGLAFVLPSFVMVTLLGMAYLAYGGLHWMQAAFYGVSASVIGIIAMSGWRLAVRTVGTDRWLLLVFLATAATTFIAESEYIVLILACGIFIWLVKSPPRHLGFLSALPPVILQTAGSDTGPLLWKIVTFFGTAGAFVFGSGLAIIPFLYGGVVREFSWLSEQQFVDAVAVAMITPGPVVITVGFIGYLVAGFPGACLASLATFIPCYLFTIIPAPYFKKFGKHPGVRSFIDGVTAAAVGAIAGAVLVLANRTLTDLPSLAIACLTALLLVRKQRVREPYLIAVAAIAGIILRLAL